MIEHIKSIVLFLLVAFSLLLTFALWTYQPQFEELEPQDYIDETKLNGEEKSIKDVIYPKNIMFHDYQNHKQLRDKQDEIELYEEMLTWEFSSVPNLTSNSRVVNQNMDWEEETNSWERNNRNRSMVLHYPVEVPMDLIDQLFTVNKAETTWNQSFNKIYFYLNSSAEEIQVVFTSEQHDKVLEGKVQSSRAYQRLEKLLDSERLMVHLVEYEIGNGNFFLLPEEKLEMESHTILTDTLMTEPFINVLFRNPSLVRQTSSSNENSYYTDGTRQLVTYPVLRDDKRVEFVNPLSTDLELTSTIDLIHKSVDFTNDHTGWTDDYKVDEIKDRINNIKYRMYYDGFPIFDSSPITEMEQEWSNNELIILKRPLFKTTELPFNEQEQKTLPSGEMVYQTLQKLDDQIPLDSIEDIQIGYKLNTRSDASSNVLRLEPEWHIKISDYWEPLSHYNEMLMNQGVE